MESAESAPTRISQNTCTWGCQGPHRAQSGRPQTQGRWPLRSTAWTLCGLDPGNMANRADKNIALCKGLRSLPKPLQCWTKSSLGQACLSYPESYFCLYIFYFFDLNLLNKCTGSLHPLSFLPWDMTLAFQHLNYVSANRVLKKKKKNKQNLPGRWMLIYLIFWISLGLSVT